VINLKLREEVEQMVDVFEQYLRVAMLQTETEFIKAETAKLNHVESNKITLGRKGVKINRTDSFEQVEKVQDPTLAFTIA
jgi:hypothetical protein